MGWKAWNSTSRGNDKKKVPLKSWEKEKQQSRALLVAQFVDDFNKLDLGEMIPFRIGLFVSTLYLNTSMTSKVIVTKSKVVIRGVSFRQLLGSCFRCHVTDW